jgi:hypothetical protein
MLPFVDTQTATTTLEGPSGRIALIKEGILEEKKKLATDSNFPQDGKKDYGTLAMGWSWASNDDLLRLYKECAGGYGDISEKIISTARCKYV